MNRFTTNVQNFATGRPNNIFHEQLDKICETPEGQKIVGELLGHIYRLSSPAVSAPNKITLTDYTSVDNVDKLCNTDSATWQVGYKPMETKPAAEIKPVETKPAAEIKPVETKPAAEIKPAETKPVENNLTSEIKPAETEPAWGPWWMALIVKPVETKPAAETQPMETNPAEEIKPAETKLATETKAASQSSNSMSYSECIIDGVPVFKCVQPGGYFHKTVNGLWHGESVHKINNVTYIAKYDMGKLVSETQSCANEIKKITMYPNNTQYIVFTRYCNTILEIKKINNDIVYIKVCGNHGRTTLCKYNKTGNEISIKSYIVDMKSIEFFYKYMDDLHIIYAGEVLYCTINAEKLTAGEIAEIHNYIYKMNPIKTALQYFN